MRAGARGQYPLVPLAGEGLTESAPAPMRNRSPKLVPRKCRHFRRGRARRRWTRKSSRNSGVASVHRRSDVLSVKRSFTGEDRNLITKAKSRGLPQCGTLLLLLLLLFLQPLLIKVLRLMAFAEDIQHLHFAFFLRSGLFSAVDVAGPIPLIARRQFRI